MTKRISGILTLALIMSVFGAPALTAQSPSKQAFSIVADVPWSFMVAGKTLPAGKYEFRQTADKPFEWTAADAKGMVKAVFATESAQMANAPKKYEAVFDVMGDTHVLVGLWLESGEGFSVPMTEAEKAMMKGEMKPAQKRVPAEKKK